MTSFDVPSHLCELLFVRRHFAITVISDLPEVLNAEQIPVVPINRAQELDDQWRALWQRGLTWRADDAAPPPSWVFEQPDHPVPVDALRTWKNRQREQLHGRIQRVQDHVPHHRSMTYTVIPVQGSWASRLAPDHWLISAAVLDSADRLAALGDRDAPEH